MKLNSFIYRQKQRIKYRLASDKVTKQIAEINRFEERVKPIKGYYYIKNLSFYLPKDKYDFVFFNFELLIRNSVRLDGQYSLLDGSLIFAWDRYKIKINNAGDLFIINEIFVEKCYYFRLPGNSTVNIIDIGMNVGLASLFFASLPYVQEVFGFEPFKPTYDLAKINFSLNQKWLNGIHTYNYGLGDKAEQLKINYDRNNPGLNTTSMTNLNIDKSLDSEVVSIKLAIQEINNLLKSCPNDKFIIKLDAEGSEFKILKNLFSQKSDPRIIGIMLEWHSKGSIELENILIKENFKLFSFNSNKRTGLIYGFR